MAKRKPLPVSTKQQIYARCNGKCKICGKHVKFKKATVDHIYAVNRGGTDDIRNLQIACRSCNLTKNCLTMQELIEKSLEIISAHKLEAIKLLFKKSNTCN